MPAVTLPTHVTRFLKRQRTTIDVSRWIQAGTHLATFGVNLTFGDTALADLTESPAVLESMMADRKLGPTHVRTAFMSVVDFMLQHPEAGEVDLARLAVDLKEERDPQPEKVKEAIGAAVQRQEELAEQRRTAERAAAQTRWQEMEAAREAQAEVTRQRHLEEFHAIANLRTEVEKLEPYAATSLGTRRAYIDALLKLAQALDEAKYLDTRQAEAAHLWAKIARQQKSLAENNNGNQDDRQQAVAYYDKAIGRFRMTRDTSLLFNLLKEVCRLLIKVTESQPDRPSLHKLRAYHAERARMYAAPPGDRVKAAKARVAEARTILDIAKITGKKAIQSALNLEAARILRAQLEFLNNPNKRFALNGAKYYLSRALLAVARSNGSSQPLLDLAEAQRLAEGVLAFHLNHGRATILQLAESHKQIANCANLQVSKQEGFDLELARTAIDHYEQALALYQRIPETKTSTFAKTHDRLGHLNKAVAKLTNEPARLEKAATHLQIASQLLLEGNARKHQWRITKAKTQIVTALYQLAILTETNHDDLGAKEKVFEAAFDAADDLRSHSEQIENPRLGIVAELYLARCLRNLGGLNNDTEQLDDARDSLVETQAKLADLPKTRSFEASINFELALVYYAQSQLGQRTANYQLALPRLDEALASNKLIAENILTARELRSQIREHLITMTGNLEEKRRLAAGAVEDAFEASVRYTSRGEHKKAARLRSATARLAEQCALLTSADFELRRQAIHHGQAAREMLSQLGEERLAAIEARRIETIQKTLPG
ncbi:MAG: hypothetical protein ABH823_00570 [bacterium]